jgi:hypothetical protein
MRIGTKAAKMSDRTIAGMDSVLKGMLVTCFGYTGYKNAKFGRVDVYMAITRISREVLIGAKELADELGFRVLHGITDCIFVQGEPVGRLKVALETASGYLLEVETFDWVVFLPQKEGTGAYTWYYGRLDTGEVKVRGIMARRGDCPAYVQRFQQEALALMGTARSIAELRVVADEVRALYGRYCDGLASAPVEDLVVGRRIWRISTVDYTRKCPERGAVASFRRAGVPVAPGMTIRYMVRDARAGLADCAWEADHADRLFTAGSWRRRGPRWQWGSESRRRRGRTHLRYSAGQARRLTLSRHRCPPPPVNSVNMDGDTAEKYSPRPASPATCDHRITFSCHVERSRGISSPRSRKGLHCSSPEVTKNSGSDERHRFRL